MKIAILGAGAAGMMAAAVICEISGENEVFLYEKNAILGRKVRISGGGRCNLTTGFTDIKNILKNYPRGHSFIKFAMYTYAPAYIREWFENHDLPLKVEDDGRVFPVSDNSDDVIEVFEKIFDQNACEVNLKTTVSFMTKKGDKFQIEFENMEKQVFDKVILCLGGQAFRHTGSTGDGYSFAESLGHTITPLSPSLNSFLAKDSWISELKGVSFQSLGFKFVVDKNSYTAVGPAILTHKGISGPAIFKLSSMAAHDHYSVEKPAYLYIDFLIRFTYISLNCELKSRIEHNPKKSALNLLHGLLPKSLIKKLLSLSDIPEDINTCEISKDSINKLIERIKNSKIKITGRGSGDEFVTAGGVNLSEIDPKTMESRICPGLFFAGEILDIDAFTGGFNLQSAWATGRLAGESAIIRHFKTPLLY